MLKSTKKATTKVPSKWYSTKKKADIAKTQFKKPNNSKEEKQIKEEEEELAPVKNIEDIISPKQLTIDFEKVVSFQYGDLAIIRGEAFKCRAIAEHLKNTPLLLKRLECVDRRTYDLKVYECQQYQRISLHPNICRLYSFWNEAPDKPYIYKMLILLMKEGVMGNMDTLIVKNPDKPIMQKIVKYFGQIAKAMSILHSNNLIHCGIKPSNIFMDDNMSPMLGEMYKVEVDSAMSNQQMFSKMLIADAMPKVLIYWAPELLKGEKYSEKVDIWAFGITCYEVNYLLDIHWATPI